MKRTVDIAVVGAGPAGAAAVVSLKAVAPELSVALVYIEAPHRASLGEGASPLVQPMLRQLGLWEDFRSQGHLEAHANHAAWGHDRLVANEYLALGHGSGWTLDRPAFDRLLTTSATAVADTIVHGRVIGLRQSGGFWVIGVSQVEPELHARIVIDATGRRSQLHRLIRVVRTPVDRMVCSFARCETEQFGGRGISVESVQNGWWYTAPVPRENRVFAYLSDADLFRQDRMPEQQVWSRALAETRHLSALWPASCGTPDVIRVCDASTRVSSVNGPLTLMAAGDAAFSVDPVCGQGIAKALREGIFAGYAAADALRDEDVGPLQRHRSFRMTAFRAYAAARDRHYAAEQRWPTSPFWYRRQRWQSESPIQKFM